ncbi:MAG: allantoin permease [Limnohabitans sp.]|nr:MAG: allantoin permease [Limnohabitans sp.]
MSNAKSPSAALSPVAPEERVFGFSSHLSLWFSLGVGLLVIQVGAYLVPAVGTSDALWAIALGSLIGAGLLGWTAAIGTRTGLSSAGLMHATYGSAFARLPVILNIVQLLGWTAFELVVMRDGTLAIVNKAFGTAHGTLGLVLATLLWGGVLALLMTGSMLTLVRRFVARVGLPLVVLSLLWLSWHFLGVLQSKGWEAFMQRPGNGSMSMLSALGLVMAMPVSWLPLVADYARHGRSSRSTLGGTWLGYALANAWCYALGVLVASVSEPGTDLVTALLLAQGGLLALGLILLDELDNAYGDVYSAAVSSSSLRQGSLRRWGVWIAVVCTGMAMVLPMHSLEPFLLMLSSVFVPLYGVILGRLGLGNAAQPERTAVDRTAVLLWVLGIVVYHSVERLAPQWGASLVSLGLTFALAALTRNHTGQGQAA